MSKDKQETKVLPELTSIHTQNFPQILEQLGISIAVTTYQAGKVILLRNENGMLNTHFSSFIRPMGMCVNRQHLYLGDRYRIIKFQNMPALSSRLEPPNKVDSCYIPRSIHITGDIDIHEMETDGDDKLWFINTKFSTLCNLDGESSFVPLWRPHFVSALADEDRCHLNGLCMIDGRPKYVTALGATDSRGGWRENKKDGGIMMDVDSNEIILDKLSMPHSPRWYREKLWLLESGKGHLSTVDLNKKKLTMIAELPGFTRGIDFIGSLAVIGLSQIRESATFSGLPITERLKERICGVWIVNIENGQTVAYMKFTAGVEEIFSVKILQQTIWPDILEIDNDLQLNSYTIPDRYLNDLTIP